LVLSLARKAGKSAPGFLIIPQNGSQLLADPEYRRSISAVALEDLYTTGKRKQPRKNTAEVLKSIFAHGDWGRPVLDTEYCRKTSLRNYCRKQAEARKILLLFTGRGLGRIGNTQ